MQSAADPKLRIVLASLETLHADQRRLRTRLKQRGLSALDICVVRGELAYSSGKILNSLLTAALSPDQTALQIPYTEDGAAAMRDQILQYVIRVVAQTQVTIGISPAGVARLESAVAGIRRELSDQIEAIEKDCLAFAIAKHQADGIVLPDAVQLRSERYPNAMVTSGLGIALIISLVILLTASFRAGVLKAVVKLLSTWSQWATAAAMIVEVMKNGTELARGAGIILTWCAGIPRLEALGPAIGVLGSMGLNAGIMYRMSSQSWVSKGYSEYLNPGYAALLQSLTASVASLALASAAFSDLTAILYIELTTAETMQGPLIGGSKVVKGGMIFSGNIVVAWVFILLVYVARWVTEAAASATPTLAECLQFAFALCAAVRGIYLAGMAINNARVRS